MYQSFFASILGLPSTWRVTHARHLDDDDRIALEIVSVPGTTLTCPACGGRAPMVSEKIDCWSHDNFFHLRIRLSVRIPLVSCETCGINPVHAPWERRQFRPY